MTIIYYDEHIPSSISSVFSTLVSCAPWSFVSSFKALRATTFSLTVIGLNFALRRDLFTKAWKGKQDDGVKGPLANMIENREELSSY